jgi:hypothetical protein
MNIALIGLVILVIGWIVQLVYSWKGKKEIQPWFIILYGWGVILLVIDGFVNKLTDLAILNLVSLIVSGLVLVRIMTKGKKGK